ncbi:hypothetical protein DSM112329_03770 [Paraconexibacter sp. AEG42_29]|uniref:Secreted protein n=1 Tax=Paraconexibacter sp. AEG42_29 TaxID=2997339 RepID=A0AAU7AZR4_9ACTN
MPPLLIFFIALAIFIGFCVVASRAYPRFTNKPEIESEQELVGVGPESTKVDGSGEDAGAKVGQG